MKMSSRNSNCCRRRRRRLKRTRNSFQIKWRTIKQVPMVDTIGLWLWGNHFASMHSMAERFMAS